MILKQFQHKLKVPANRDSFFITILSLILIISGFTMDWCESVLNFLYKYQQYPFDDFIMSFTVISVFIFWYGLRRNNEKKAIIKQQYATKNALRKTQDNLQFLLKSSSSIIYNTEASGNFKLLYMTENVSSILGYNKEEYYETGWWFNNIHPEDQPRVSNELANLSTTGSLSCDYRFKHKNSNWVWMHSNSQLLYDVNGKPTETVGTWWDITKQRASQEIFKKNNESFI